MTHVCGEVVAGRFRLLGAINKGKMGEVPRADNLQVAPDDPSRMVAVKLNLSCTAMSSRRTSCCCAVAVKVLDFGIGRIIDNTAQGRLTSGSVRVDAARYMAPEQLGSAMAIRATDLYAFCCILFELFAGKPPFVEANVLDLASKQRNNPAAGHDGPQRRPDHRHSAVLHLPRVLNLA